MSLTTLLTIAVLAFVGTRVAQGSRIALVERRHHVLHLVRGLRLRHVLTAVPTLVVVATAAFLLSSLPVLSWGWWTALGGQGNPVIGSTDETVGTTWEWLIPLVFLVALLPALPLFAEREEVWFRLGAERRSFVQRRVQDLRFGMVHALIGIPLGVALALSLGGTMFTWHYLRGYRTGGRAGGVLESTRAHLAYNGIIVVGIALPAFVALALGDG